MTDIAEFTLELFCPQIHSGDLMDLCSDYSLVPHGFAHAGSFRVQFQTDP